MKKNYLLTMIFVLASLSVVLGQRKMENLNRGLVAVRTNPDQVYIAWRLLGYDPDAIAFNLYRDGVLLNDEPIKSSTNYLDETQENGIYQVKAILNNEEISSSESISVWQQNYLEIPLQTPSGGTTPDGVSYTYTANDASVGDLDGDGQYEVILKWDPTNAKDNSHEGYTGNVYLDAYTFTGELKWRIDLGVNIRAGAHYTQFMVYDFDGDGKAEIACKTADGTTDALGNVIGDANADYRNSTGRILEGPEFLTVFNGETGKAMATTDYVPARGSVDSWGDNYGNRVDRFLGGVAYLDGQHPSLVMCRGYYTRAVIAAWDWKNGELTQRWIFDSNDEGNEGYAGQGNHNLSIADVDADGKDEIVYGSMTVNDDGTGLYTTGLGHGDALHVSDFDPERPGLEVFMPHENKVDGLTFRSASDGEIIWQHKMNTDVGRALAADIDSTHLGAEFWASSGLGVYNTNGDQVQTDIPSINFSIWWDDDLDRELLDGNSIRKYGKGTVFTAENCSSNNGTKATPNLQADLFGDWREEVMFRTSDNKALRIFVNPEMSSRRLYTLMHDSQYRTAIAWQNTGYNQPPWPSFYIGYGMKTPPPAPLTNNKLRWGSGDTWDIESSSNWVYNDVSSVYHQGDNVLFDVSETNETSISLVGDLKPSSVMVNSASDYIFNGTGFLSGEMDLIKRGSGNLTLENDNIYNGNTTVWEGSLNINGHLSESPIELKDYAELGGNGSIDKAVKMGKEAKLSPGGINQAGILTMNGEITAGDNLIFNLDLSEDPNGANDKIIFTGDVNIEEGIVFSVNVLNEGLSTGNYTLIEYSNSFNVALDQIEVTGIPGIKYELNDTGNAIVMEVEWVRNPTTVYWKGDTNNIWDLAETYNWFTKDSIALFAPGDTVVLDDSGILNTSIYTTGTLPMSNLIVNASIDYTIEGDGNISGEGGLEKLGIGKLIINNQNSYKGVTLIKEGTLSLKELSDGEMESPIGAATANPENIIIDGGMLEITENIETNRGMTLSDNDGTLNITNEVNAVMGGIIAGNGSLDKIGMGSLELNGKNSFTGGTVLKEGTIHLGTEEGIASGFGEGVVKLEGGLLSMNESNNSYSKASWDVEVPSGKQAEWRLDGRCEFHGKLLGSGDLNLYAPWIRSEMYGDWSNFTGKVSVTTDSDGGWLILGNKNGYKNVSIALTDGVQMVYRLNANDTLSVGTLTGTENAILGAGWEKTTTTWRIGTNNTDAIFNGIISDASFKGSGTKTAIIKAGTGIWELTNANIYSGETLVESGTLVVNNTSGSATGNGKVTVAQDAVLSGNGQIEGNLILEADAKLRPGGKREIGTLTFNKNAYLSENSRVEIDLGRGEGNYDTLKVVDTLFCNGQLKLGKNGIKFQENDSFSIIDAGTIQGEYSQIIPSPGHGMEWDTTELYTDGILKVIKKKKHHHDEYDKNSIVYPNPVKDYINIKLDNSNQITNNAYLYDLSGMLLKSQTFGGSASAISTHNLKSGIYILKVINNEGEVSQTIVKE